MSEMSTKKRRMQVNLTRALLLLAAMASSLALLPARGDAQDHAQKPPEGKVVYVCACLKTKSCSCMTEAKTEGPCACGTEGGPPLKAVPKDSAWAKANRKALAK
jgi:hypothetical protein